MPATQMNRDSPTLPVSSRMELGVAKIPVPMMRLKIRNEALTTPICRRLSGVLLKTLLSSAREIQLVRKKNNNKKKSNRENCRHAHIHS